MFEFKLSRNLAGKLVLTTADGMVHEGVVPVRAFPVAAPDFFVAIMSLEGKEIAWIDDLQKLPEDTRQYIQDEIASRELIRDEQNLRSKAKRTSVGYRLGRCSSPIVTVCVFI